MTASSSDEALAALERLAASGRKLILVTGRELPDLEEGIRPDRYLRSGGRRKRRAALHAGDRAPSANSRQAAAGAGQAAFRRAASRRSRSAARSSPPGSRTKHAVLEAIRELGLELQIIFNKGAVMVLPSGVNKATGLAAALEELGLSPHNVVGVGDAENDHAFLRRCGCAWR